MIQIFNKKRLFFDGAMGTMLQEGFSPVDIYKKYISAGSDIITSNTFGVFDEARVESAMKELKMAIGDSNVLAALDIGPTGQLLEPYGDLEYDECIEIFQKAVNAGTKAGADLILIETMMDINEIKAAVLAAKTSGLPIIATMTFDKNGRTSMGVSLETMVNELENLVVDAIGMNCGFGPELYEELLPKLAELTKLPILVQPNAGLPEIIDGKPHYSMTPRKFAKAMKRMSEYATMLGGCCGTTPDHIKEMIGLCKKLE